MKKINTWIIIVSLLGFASAKSSAQTYNGPGYSSPTLTCGECIYSMGSNSRSCTSVGSDGVPHSFSQACQLDSSPTNTPIISTGPRQPAVTCGECVYSMGSTSRSCTSAGSDGIPHSFSQACQLSSSPVNTPTISAGPQQPTVTCGECLYSMGSTSRSCTSVGSDGIPHSFSQACQQRSVPAPSTPSAPSNNDSNNDTDYEPTPSPPPTHFTEHSFPTHAYNPSKHPVCLQKHFSPKCITIDTGSELEKRDIEELKLDVLVLTAQQPVSIKNQQDISLPESPAAAKRETYMKRPQCWNLAHEVTSFERGVPQSFRITQVYNVWMLTDGKDRQNMLTRIGLALPNSKSPEANLVCEVRNFDAPLSIASLNEAFGGMFNIKGLYHQR